MNLEQLRAQIEKNKFTDEHSLVNQLVFNKSLSHEQRTSVLIRSHSLVDACRKDKGNQDLLDSFLLEFGLSNKEGVGLMCLAEALLRVPDAMTADRLIAEKIQSGDWISHAGNSESLFVNASTWGLILTGKLVQLDPQITETPGTWIKNLCASLGEPAIRAAVFQAMKIMGGQYVLGRTIDEGMRRSEKGTSGDAMFSFDMLGEGARNEADAEKYCAAYADAIEEIGKANMAEQKDLNVYQANAISVKLSALHAKYHFSHFDLVMQELLPRITELCVTAKKYDIGLSIDAEEAERLDISLDIFENLAKNPQLKGWQGLGFVLQSYQKRAIWVARWLIALSQESERKIMVRLVKGAYWDAEIKQAQEQGLTDYPVFTRKANTDLSYLSCAKILLDAEEEIYPQFATHNAYTATALIELAKGRNFEFQRLHGMGKLLYKKLFSEYGQEFPLRIYAPIGAHEDLLPYLVRRLLENGANSSFVNRFLDQKMPIRKLVQDVFEQVTEVFPYKHKKIPKPENIYEFCGDFRKNSRGMDLSSKTETERLTNKIQHVSNQRFDVGPIVGGKQISPDLYVADIENPANLSHVIGRVASADESLMEDALTRSVRAHTDWKNTRVEERALILNRMADLLESERDKLIAIISIEAGRTIADAVSEVREAVDFCRYYALSAKEILNNHQGLNNSGLHSCGTFFCVSPWNFPLAIFTGQIAAALAMGNCVIAKPAAQTPVIAYKTIELFHQAGIPVDCLHLLTGSGSQTGAKLIPDPRIKGICFTGSTETAQAINQELANRAGSPIPFIAETGGQNCMVIDSTALPEQIVDDVIASSFQSAGQRCSALRVLFIQEDIADRVLQLLSGAMHSVTSGNPGKLSTDVGPVIDKAAKQTLLKHSERMANECTFSAQAPVYAQSELGNFFAPRVFEIDSIHQLEREVFGPVLHVIRFASDKLDDVIEQINSTGYGLTLGVHSRIEAFAEYIFNKTCAGNTYINRNMVGAVVGVNPFGGNGLSGTGPKAGGPNYLYRFSQPGIQIDRGNKAFEFKTVESTDLSVVNKALDLAAQAQKDWQSISAEKKHAFFQQASIAKGLKSELGDFLNTLCKLLKKRLSQPVQLAGPTGEENLLYTRGKGIVLCLVQATDSPKSIGLQISLSLAAGCIPVICGDETAIDGSADLIDALMSPGLPRNSIQRLSDSYLASCIMDPRTQAVVATGSQTDLSIIKQYLAERQGAITPLVELPEHLFAQQPETLYALMTNLIIEKTRSENLVARGGNTQLFNLKE